MTIWFSSDIHFGHKNIIDYCNRPFNNVDHMNETIIANFNSLIAPEDTLILVGDLCMGRKDDTIPLLGRINGKKIAVGGNHDPWHPAYEKRIGKRAEWTARYYNESGVRATDIDTQICIDGVDVRVCHFPYSGDHTEDERFSDFRPVDDGHWLIHGHVHDLWQVNGRQINVGVDVWDFFPVHIDTIRGIIRGGQE